MTADEPVEGRCPICRDVRHVAATPEECTALWLAYRTQRRAPSPSVPVESREQPSEEEDWDGYVPRPSRVVERATYVKAERWEQALAERDRARDLAAHLRDALDAILNPTGWIHLENANRDALCGSTATTTMSRVENADCSACLALAAHLEAELSQQADSK